MEKDRLLDAHHSALIRKGLSVISDLKNLINFKLSPISGYGLLFFSIIILFISSCGLPRIIILTDPLSPEEHINLGLSYEEKAEYDAALREYETAAKKLDIAYLYIGNLYFKMGDYEKAERAYRKAIKKTSDPRAMNNLAWLYYILNKDLDRAEELAQEAVKKDPGNQDFIDTLMRIRERRGGHAF